MFYLSSLSGHLLFAGLEHLYFVSSLTSHFLLKADCLWGLDKAAWEVCSRGCSWTAGSVWCQYLQFWYRTSQLLHSNWGCCEGDSAKRKIGRAGIERDISIPSCLLQLFPCLPSSMLAVCNWIQNYLVLHLELRKKRESKLQKKIRKVSLYVSRQRSSALKIPLVLKLKMRTSECLL